ncbi:MAG TPA: hypothetical protein VMV92_20170 [Streptosporangiaceae bacterium]|nr:hypothetical protein [Streptosporangiaceae bacterium]
MSDNNYDSVFGPSTPGALDVTSGNDGGGYAVSPSTGATVPDPGTVSALNSQGLGTIYGDMDPAYDDCSDSSHTSSNPVGVMTGPNIGTMGGRSGVHRHPGAAGQLPGPVRLRSAATAAGDLPVHPGQLRQPQRLRPQSPTWPQVVSSVFSLSRKRGWRVIAWWPNHYAGPAP